MILLLAKEILPRAYGPTQNVQDMNPKPPNGSLLGKRVLPLPQEKTLLKLDVSDL